MLTLCSVLTCCRWWPVECPAEAGMWRPLGCKAGGINHVDRSWLSWWNYYVKRTVHPKIKSAYKWHSAWSAMPLSRNRDSVSPDNPQILLWEFLCRNCFLFDRTTLVNHIGMQKESMHLLINSLTVSQCWGCCSASGAQVVALCPAVLALVCPCRRTFLDIWASGVSCLVCLCSAKQMCVRRETA